MRLLKLITIMAIFSLALLGLNCKDSESPEGAIPDNFVGTWEADSSREGTLIELALAGEPNQGVDLRDFGAEVRAVINKDGTYSLNMNLIFLPVEDDQGEVTIDEESKVIIFNSNDPESEPVIFFYKWENDILVLTVQADLDLGEGEVPYDVTIKLVKTS